MHKLMIATVVLLGACGSDAISLADYQAARRDAICKYLVTCGDLESVDACRANFGSLFGRLSASDQAVLDMDRATFDGDAAAACVGAIGTRSCDQSTRSARVLPDACDQIITGKLGDGAVCARDTECRSLSCDVPACNVACCAGTCFGDAVPAVATLGESCEHARCDATSFCDATLKCVALQLEGAPCTSGSACDFGLSCVLRGTGLVCAALPKLGEACTDYCREQGTTCSAATKTCVKLGHSGAACTTSADCSLIYHCDAALQCSPGLAVGAACTAIEACAGDGGFCDVPASGGAGICALPKANGSACKDNRNCQSQTCDPRAHTCVPEPVCI